jgi:hypothetical protein
VEEGVFLVPINQLLKCGWRKIIMHVLARDSARQVLV